MKMNRRGMRRSAQRIWMLLLTLFFIVVGSMIFGSTFSTAHGNRFEEPIYNKCYKSIQIESGDTLWDIAKEYQNDTYCDIQEYINELKRINGLATDDIHESRYLTVIYYEDSNLM